MALKNQYFCKKLAAYVKPEVLSSKAQEGLALVTGLNCSDFSSGFCREYGGVCSPYKKAVKDARYENRKNINGQIFAGKSDMPDEKIIPQRHYAVEDPRPTPLESDRAVRRFLEKQHNLLGGSPIKNSIECGRFEKAAAKMIKKGLKRLK